MVHTSEHHAKTKRKYNPQNIDEPAFGGERVGGGGRHDEQRHSVSIDSRRTSTQRAGGHDNGCW